jgi:hypothetical protein
MKTMTWCKVLHAAGLGAAVLLAGCSKARQAQTGAAGELAAQDIVQKLCGAYAALTSYRDSGTVAMAMGKQVNTLSLSTRLQRPNLYRIDWTQGTGPSGIAWSDGSGDYLLTAAAGPEESAQPKKLPSLKATLSQAAGPSVSAASSIPGVFFNQDCGDVFLAPALSGRFPLKREDDAKVGEVDCYVVSSEMDLSKAPALGKPGTASTMLWIGKGDFLIHQCRTKYVEKVASTAPSDAEMDAAIVKSLEAQHRVATPEAVAAMRPQMKAIMKQVQATLKAGFKSGIVFTQTRENIVVNEEITLADFSR